MTKCLTALLLFAACTLFAGEERINIDLDSSWTLIQDHQEGKFIFKIWEQGEECMMFMATPRTEARESIEEGLKANSTLMPEDISFTILEKSADEALVLFDHPSAGKTLSKIIYTPNASCIISRSYTGKETKSVAISEWRHFFKEHVRLDIR